MTHRSYCLLALAWLCALAPFAPAAAQADDAYPSRPIHIVIPFPAGGPSDIAARIIAQKMNEDWGQPVIVDNRPGANTIIGAETVAKAAPDGYTLLMAIDSTLVMNQYLYKTLPYDPLNDFAPITTTVKSMSLLCVPAETGPKSVEELIARGKAAPGKLNYGAGTITVQLAGLLFNKAAGIDVVYVPFKGTRRDGAGPAHRLASTWSTPRPWWRAADRERQGARARQARRPQGALPRRADAGRGGEPAEFRRHFDLARPGRAQGARRSRSSTSSTAKSCTFCPSPTCGRNSTRPAISPSPARRRSLPRSSAARRRAGRRC